MNQILVTQKLYMTPELKRKKKIYRFEFIISIFLVCILFSYYIYAEYDKSKNEQLSQEILSDLNIEETLPEEDNTTIQMKDNILIVILDDEEQEEVVKETPKVKITSEKYTTKTGDSYTIIAKVNIPKLNKEYPIISKTTDELLKISPCKFWGPKPNEVGNFCIVGHNYRNEKFFSKVPTLERGDTIELTDMEGRTIKYVVYTKYTVDPADVACTSQLTKGRKEVTLITCTDDSKQRVVVKAREVK